MRNALIVLVVIALVLVAVGAVNNDVAFDVDFLAIAWTDVSLFWVSVVMAGIVLIAGFVAAYLARTGAVRGLRKLEAELTTTYQRLRVAEAAAAAPAAVAPGVMTAVAPPPEEETAFAPPAEGQTSITEVAPPTLEEAPTGAAPASEASTAAGPPTEGESPLPRGEEEVAADSGPRPDGPAGAAPVTTDVPDDATAVTMAPPAADVQGAEAAGGDGSSAPGPASPG